MNQERRYAKGLAPASGAVAAWLGSQELAAALRPHMAKARWVGVVGPQVANVTQVEAVRDGVLYVRVKNSVWANELTLLKDDMVRRLNLALGGRVITDIHFKGGGLRRAKESEAGPKKPVILPGPTAAELARIMLSSSVRTRVNATAGSIMDEKLRERIRASLLRVARLDEWKRRQGWCPCPRCATLTAPDPAHPTPLCPLCRAGVSPV